MFRFRTEPCLTQIDMVKAKTRRVAVPNFIFNITWLAYQCIASIHITKSCRCSNLILSHSCKFTTQSSETLLASKTGHFQSNCDVSAEFSIYRNDILHDPTVPKMSPTIDFPNVRYISEYSRPHSIGQTQPHPTRTTHRSRAKFRFSTIYS